MAKPQSFREESFFTGAEKDRGFSPSQAVDISPILREQMAEHSRQIGNLRSQQAVQNEAELNKRVQNYKALGTIAPKFLEAANMLGQAYLSHQRVEANHRTRKLGEASNFVPTQEQAAVTQELDAAEREAIGLAPILDEAKKAGAMPEGIRMLKELSGADAVAGPRNYAHNRALNYKKNLLEFLQNSDIRLRKPQELGGGFFTPSEIDDNPVLAQIALDAYAKMYDIDTGVEYLSDGVLRPYNESISKVNKEVLAAVEERKRINQGSADVSQHTETFLRNKDINLLLSNVTGTYAAEKGSRGFAEATELVFDKLLPSLIYSGQLTEPELRAALKQPSSAEFAKGKTHEVFYRTRLYGPNGLFRKINEKANYDFTQRQKEKERVIAADKEDYFDTLAKLREQGVVLSQDQIDQRRRNVMKATGINDPSAFSYYDDYQTSEEVAEEAAKDKLDYLRSVNGRGYLVAEDLEGLPQSVVTTYSQAVRDDAEYAKFAGDYAVRGKARVTSLTNDFYNNQSGRDEKTTDWNKRYDRAYADYLVERQRLLRTLGVENHADAHEGALAKVEKNYKDGLYKTLPAATDHTARVEQITNYRTRLKKGEKIFQQPDLWSDPIKKNLDDFNAGKVKSYDPIFDTLALNIPGKTGWDLANELHRTINGTDLKKTVKQEAIEAQGPAVQRFIRAEGVTPNRIRRGQIMDDPQGSFNPRPAAFEAIPKENFTLETPGSGSYQPGFDVWIPSKRVPALYPGIVKDVRTQYNADGSGYGNFVVIESTNPLTGQKFDVLVSHLAERTPLREGQRVAPGQIIGTQGGTGSVRSVDGTITSYDFLAVAPKGSGSMKPADNLDELRNDAINRLQGGV